MWKLPSVLIGHLFFSLKPSFLWFENESEPHKPSLISGSWSLLNCQLSSLVYILQIELYYVETFYLFQSWEFCFSSPSLIIENIPVRYEYYFWGIKLHIWSFLEACKLNLHCKISKEIAQGHSMDCSDNPTINLKIQVSGDIDLSCQSQRI